MGPFQNFHAIGFASEFVFLACIVFKSAKLFRLSLRVAFKLVLNVWVAFKLEFVACVAF